MGRYLYSSWEIGKIVCFDKYSRRAYKSVMIICYLTHLLLLTHMLRETIVNSQAPNKSGASVFHALQSSALVKKKVWFKILYCDYFKQKEYYFLNFNTIIF